MGIFNIKLKTKNGNDVHKKVTFTAWYCINYKVNALTENVTAEFTYRIISSNNLVHDPKCVLEIKNKANIKSREDLNLKVIINILSIIGKMSEGIATDPDFILIFTPEINEKISVTWRFTHPLFQKGKVTPGTYQDYKVNKGTTNMIRDIVKKNPNTKFMVFDPARDAKHIKSVKICEMLNDRLSRSPQITEEKKLDLTI